MARRLSPDARRAEIIEKTREMIAVQGPTGLSLRSVARYCGITHPAVLHHFDGLADLLETVLSMRDEEEYRAAIHLVSELGSDATVFHLGDALTQYFAERPVETQNFDALEAEAVASPAHPAHAYYAHREGTSHAQTVALAARDYSDPEAVVEMLLVVVDGLRHRWLRSQETPDYVGDWQRLRRAVETSFEHLRVSREPAERAE